MSKKATSVAYYNENNGKLVHTEAYLGHGDDVIRATRKDFPASEGWKVHVIIDQTHMIGWMEMKQA